MDATHRSFLILPGWGGSGPEHWQTWLAQRLTAAGETVFYPALPDVDNPVLDIWLEALQTVLASMPGAPVVVCHSLAVLLWLHYAQTREPVMADRLLLVAPPGPAANTPQVATFFPPPIDPAALQRSAWDILLVCTDADPFCPERAVDYYGRPLGIRSYVLPPEAGHINVAAGYGPWPWADQWCRGAA